MDSLERFIVFEGIDGAGTTTQARLLCKKLRDRGARVWATSEPTSGPVGLLLRRILGGEVAAPPETVAFLFAADRSFHLSSDDGIRAHLDRGEIVVCDRYKYSSLAYQTVDTPEEIVMSLNVRFPDPALLLFVDLPAEMSGQRLSRRRTLEIFENEDFQKRVRDNYRRVIAEAAGHTDVRTFDGTAGLDELAEKIWEQLENSSIQIP